MDWVPFFQTMAWIALIIYSANKFSSQLQDLLNAIKMRISSGSSFKAGPIELGQDLKALDRVMPSMASEKTHKDDWSKERDGIYNDNNGFFLAHVISPSEKGGQTYDVFIYLIKHKSKEFSDIEFAEFFLGAYWGNEVYREKERNGLIGISTSAYGPFLCTCRIMMKNGKEIRLNRYIDFEMGKVFEHNN